MLARDSDFHHLEAMPGPPTAAARHARLRRAAVGAMLVVLGFFPLAVLGRSLWREWNDLLAEEAAAESAAVVGYPNIYPKISRAGRPDPWRRVEEGRVFVWSGWQAGEGHRWFQLGCDECEPSAIGPPIGRDVAQAIDHPAVETQGGPIWGRIPADAEIAGITIGGTVCAYPMTVLDKVLVVNDLVDGAPYLVYNDPTAVEPDGAEVAIYAAQLDGRRITMGSGGFSIGGRHVLYDRGTESLWTDHDGALEAVSGRHKGKRLALVKRVSQTHWRDWRDDEPGLRLLVGSLDRSRGVPAE